MKGGLRELTGKRILENAWPSMFGPGGVVDVFISHYRGLARRCAQFCARKDPSRREDLMGMEQFRPHGQVINKLRVLSNG